MLEVRGGNFNEEFACESESSQFSQNKVTVEEVFFFITHKIGMDASMMEGTWGREVGEEGLPGE